MPQIKILRLKIVDVIDSVLKLIKGYVPKKVYSRVRRLLEEGTERDLVFMQGVATGVKLTKLGKKNTANIVKILKEGIKRADKGKKPLLKKNEIDTIEKLLKGSFNYGARIRISKTLAKADGMMLEELIDMLK